MQVSPYNWLCKVIDVKSLANLVKRDGGPKVPSSRFASGPASLQGILEFLF